jgi:hypothetical protein
MYLIASSPVGTVAARTDGHPAKSTPLARNCPKLPRPDTGADRVPTTRQQACFGTDRAQRPSTEASVTDQDIGRGDHRHPGMQALAPSVQFTDPYSS